MATLEKLSILQAWAEVYIFAMISNSSAPANILLSELLSVSEKTLPINSYKHSKTFERTSICGKSLLNLVEPELANLSKHWFDALKDHALLRLPYKFQSQFSHYGGAFFTTDTINSSKPHYLSSWPSILYAASLWLSNGGYEFVINSSNIQDFINSNNMVTSISTHSNKNKLYMLFGICMEALCSARTSEKSKNVLSSLQSLYTLFFSKCSKILLIENREVIIELCQVLHRQILIREDIAIQLLCIEILRQTVSVYFVNIEQERSQNDAKMIEAGILDEILPGECLVYSVLEACLCIFVRHIPSMNSLIPFTDRKYRNVPNFNDDNYVLISSGLCCAESLLYICSPNGAVSILSTVLYMTTTILKEFGKRSITNSQKGIADSLAVKSALHCLKSVCIHKYAKDKKSSHQWKQLVRSSLSRIIHMSKIGNDLEDGEKMNETTMLTAMSIFILNAEPSVVLIPSLLYPCLNHFIQCLQSDDKQIGIKCIHIVKSIFTNSDLQVSTPFIHALAPSILEKLYDVETKYPRDEVDVAYTLESIAVTETLISLCQPKNRKLYLSFYYQQYYYGISFNYLNYSSRSK